MTLNDSLNKTLSFNGQEYALWKEKIKIITEEIYFDIQKDVNNDSFVPTHQVDGVVINKEEDYWANEEREKVYSNLIVKTIITVVLCIDELLRVSRCKTTIFANEWATIFAWRFTNLISKLG